MISIQDEYRGLLAGTFFSGKPKEDRTGIGTKSVFGRMISHDMALGFPLLTTKRIYFNHAVTELLWILQGRTDLNYLRSNGVSYWDSDYERSGRTDNTLGPVYGHQLRNFNGVDQLERILLEIKTNPSSRRIMASFWNPCDLDDMVLPPCHYSFQCYVANGKLSLMWNQRSADLFLGVPFNISSYGLLLELLCVETGYEPGDLIGNFGDIHLYKNHIEQAKEQISRKPFELPQLGLVYENILEAKFEAQLQNYQCHPAIKAPLSN